MTTEKLENSLVEKIRNLKNKQGEIIVNVGQLHLEIKQLQIFIEASEKEYQLVSTELNEILSELEKKYPNGEIDLNEGTVIY